MAKQVKSKNYYFWKRFLLLFIFPKNL